MFIVDFRVLDHWKAIKLYHWLLKDTARIWTEELNFTQGVKVGALGRQNERKRGYVKTAHTSIFGLCFMPVCLMKSNCYSLIYSSLTYSNALYLEMLLHWVKAYNKFLGLIVTSFYEVSMSEPYWHRQPVAMIVMLLYLLCHDSKFQPMRNEH